MREEDRDLKKSNQPRVENLLLKVLGGVVLLLSIYLWSVFIKFGRVYGMDGMFIGMIMWLTFIVLLIELAVTLIRRKKVSKIDASLIVVNLILFLLYFFVPEDWIK